MMAEPDRYQIERDSINKQLAIFKKSLNVIKKDPQLSRLLGQANSERNRQQSIAQGQINSNKPKPSNQMQNIINNNQMHNNYVQQSNHNDNNGSTRNNNGNHDREMVSNNNQNQPNQSTNTKPQQQNFIQGIANQVQTAVKSKPKLILFKQENKD